MFTTLVPMRRPVKEPGPDMKVISVMSLNDLPFSCNLSFKNCSNFSARSWPEFHS